jgi:hypothetical protein
MVCEGCSKLLVQRKQTKLQGYSIHGTEVHTRSWWKNQKERDHQEDPDINGRIILKLISEKYNVRVESFSPAVLLSGAAKDTLIASPLYLAHVIHTSPLLVVSQVI